MKKMKGFGEGLPKIATSKVKSHNKKTKKSIQENKTKAFINKTLADSGKNTSIAIVLDGPDIKTTKALVKAGWRKTKIHNVNCSNDYYTIAKKHRRTYNCTMHEFLYERKGEKRKIGLIYLDYMCTWPGNDVTTPELDIDLLFDEDLLAEGAILGITLSTRAKRDNEFFKYQDIGKVMNHIFQAGQDNGRRIQILEGGAYNNAGSMFSYIFKVI